MTDRKPPVPRRDFWLATALFFVSGGTGLAYQVVWFKRFSHVWGSTSLAFAAVAGSFLFGLGLGAWQIGRRADRLPRPLRIYGLCELLIGVLALVIPFEIAGLVNASVRLYAAIPTQAFLRFLIQFAITLIVIGPPCVLMGGTLPLLIRQLTARHGPLDQATGWLYAVNTLGAALGCYLTGFHLLPSLGLLWTNHLAAALNLTIGLVAIRLAGGRVAAVPAASPMSAAPAAAPPVAPAPVPRAAYLAAALSGFGALVLEMTWGRQLALVLGGSTYAFSATLFVVLVGIALGSLIFHAWLRPRASDPILPLVAIGALILATLIGKWALPWLSEAVSPLAVRQLRGQQLGNGMICVGASLALELVPAVAMGVLFPAFVNATRASAARVGSAVGNVYAWNTAGSIAGAGLTAVLLFPHLGTAGAMAIAAASYVATLLAMLPRADARGRVISGAAVAGGAIVVALLARPADPRLTNLGMYYYGGPADLAGELFAGDHWRSALSTVWFREGSCSNVLVSRMPDGTVVLRVNGKVDGSSGYDMGTQLGLAYFPRLFAPQAREVMVIGFGTGTTSGASLQFPGTHVTCCEIEPAVLEASAAFGEVNRRPERSAAFSRVVGDGRTAIQGSSRKYDLIISEPSNPWLAGVSSLFTREFFRTVREHLTPGGVLAQWVQTYNFTLDDYRMIVRTLRSEFPHCGVAILADGSDTVLLASLRPLLPDAATLDRLQRIVDRTPAIASDLERWFGGTDVRRLLTRYYQLGQAQVDGLLRSDPAGPLNTDLHLRLEFDAPLHLFRSMTGGENAAVALLRSVDPEWIGALADAAGVPRGSAEFQAMLGDQLLDRLTNTHVRALITRPGDLEAAAAHFDSALARRPDLATALRGLAHVRLFQGRREDAVATLGRAVRVEPGDAATRAELGQELLVLRRYAESAPQFREALRLRGHVSSVDGTAGWANNLAWMLATSTDPRLRDGAEAVQWAERACAADQRNNPLTLDTYGAALAATGRYDEAIRVSKRILALVPDHLPSVAAIEARIRIYESHQPLRE